MPNMEFTKGIRVEVSSDEEGFCEPWFTATIIDSVGEKFLIEYEHLRTDDETELLRETIDPLHIRPTPPATPANENFKFLDEVDALYNDGWWVGVISKVLDSPRYAVYFKTSQEEMEFNHQELRLHYDWVDGMWLQASKQVRDEHAVQTKKIIPALLSASDATKAQQLTFKLRIHFL